MTTQEWEHCYDKACAALNTNIWCADTEVGIFKNACIYGKDYNRGLSECFWEFANDVNHPSKVNIFLRELDHAGIPTSKNSHVS